MRTVTVTAADTTAQIPVLGLGTWELEGDDCNRAVQTALGMGYRHIDTAQMYGNEDRVGAALQAASIPRDQIWLTTKIDNGNHTADVVRSSTEDSLRKLQTDYVDLLLIHWPVELERLGETLDAMTALVADGKVAHIGVSNFTSAQLEQALELAPVANNQVEYHPYLGQQQLRKVAGEHGIALTAYSPLARGKVLDDKVLDEIGQDHNASAAQVALAWLLTQDQVVAIPKATTKPHLESNLAALELSLTADERQRIDALESGDRIINPPFGPW